MRQSLPITFIIKSFRRHGCVRRLVASIRESGYTEKVLILNDDGEKLEVDDPNTQVIEAEFDIGLSTGRNRLVDAVTTENLVLLDDDFIFCEETDIGLLVDGLKTYDIVAGATIDRRSDDGLFHYEGIFERDGDTLFQKQSQGLEQYDYVPNFFAARTETLRRCRWDDELKMGEHMAFFYAHKGEILVSQDVRCRILHEHVNTPVYGAFRNRALMYMTVAMRKFGLKRLVYDACLADHRKVVYELDGGSLLRDGKVVYSPCVERSAKGVERSAKGVDFLITTFKRHGSLEKLLTSIAKYYPYAQVHIADQDYDANFYKGLRERIPLKQRFLVHEMPYDSGVSHSRNHLVSASQNRYKLILDDDFEFTEKTDIGKMVRLMEKEPSCQVVGGSVNQLGYVMHFEHFIELKDGEIRHVSDGDKWRNIGGLTAKRTGCVLNFALFRKDVFNQIQWDPRLKVSEHIDFYLRMGQLPFQVWYLPEVEVSHPPAERNEDYRELRQRPEFLAMMLKKHGAQRMIYLNGQVVELTDEGIKRYRLNQE